jgi:hypothetical protein
MWLLTIEPRSGVNALCPLSSRAERAARMANSPRRRGTYPYGSSL